MGYRSYSNTDRTVRAKAMKFSTNSIGDNFKAKRATKDMTSIGVAIRESRDSEENPESNAIIIALDVTGSMGNIPHMFVKDGLPTIMGTIYQAGVRNPQVLFSAIGDHECDNSPLQVSQFETSDGLLDKWLTQVYLEGGGGGNDGESYLLAWYFAALHTSIDCFEKRKQKGFLFTIGDEATLREVPEEALKTIMGGGQPKTYTAAELLAKAKEMYHVYHLHITETGAGKSQRDQDSWKQLMGDDVIFVDDYTNIPKIIGEKIVAVKAEKGHLGESVDIDKVVNEKDEFEEFVEDNHPSPYIK